MMHETFAGTRTFLVLITVGLIAGCSTAPEALRGTYPDLSPENTTARDIGRDVRWGGVILDAMPDPQQTCFEVLSRELDRSLRPRAEDLTEGRFIACRTGFLDPEVFAKGREITLTGTVRALDRRKVGEFNYQYPLLSARFITMWPERPDVIITNSYDPWYWGPYWGPHWGGYYGRWGAPPIRTTVRTPGSNERIDVPEKGSPKPDG